VPNRNPLDDQIADSMAAFRAATSVQVMAIPSHARPQKILVCFDRSNQDDLTQTLADALCSVFAATPVLELADPSLEPAARQAALEARKARWPGAEILPAGSGDAASRILAAREHSGAGLVLMPAPYLEDIGALGRDSVGSTSELVLARASVPVLFVREPRKEVESFVHRPLLAVTVQQPEAVKAAALAFELAKGGDLRLLFVVDTHAIAQARAVLGHTEALSEEHLLAEAKAHSGSFVAACQHHANRLGAKLSVDFMIGRESDLLRQESERDARLLVIASPQDRDHPMYSRALSILRQSPLPVLIV